MHLPLADRHLYVLGGPSAHVGFLNCERISERSHIHDWSVEAHYHEGLAQLFVFAKGQVGARLDYAPESITGPAMVWLPALCSHAFEYETGMEGWVITIPTGDLSQLSTEAPYLDHWINRPQLLVGEDHITCLTEAIDITRRIETAHCEALEDQNLALKSLFCLLLVLLNRGLRDNRALQDGNTQRKRYLVHEFQCLVENPATSSHSVAEFAKALSVTSTHLSRTVKAATGRTASEILSDQMLLKAKRMLAFSDQSISDIAFALGFSSPSYFSRFFSARASETPRDFRKRIRSQ
ncbi:AraC family transcriptional regulator [Paracoccus saliphilus]|uniref:Helix-turn-helix domain-containing protein n=1 Tax=Paracoccus saliphilus TaxID=405559 RepID=A0AA45W654_9RHOB|nr:AraC family transcriptional regulator [Paracoccus saliphilus]WCR01521.1 helix-turn-helix domain-containing protein [Paracoccus saliphilus]SIS99312.1 transcriptional regulator, AraC family [Paracoccus saliphilus]